MVLYQIKICIRIWLEPVHVQIFFDGRWQTAAVFEPDARKLEKGIAGGGRLQYDIDYAVAYLGNRAAELIPGLTVGFELFRFEQWPPSWSTCCRGALADGPGSGECRLRMTARRWIGIC